MCIVGDFRPRPSWYCSRQPENLGLDRKDMIISDLAKGSMTDEQRKDEIMIKTERDSIRLGENESFAEGFEDYMVGKGYWLRWKYRRI